MEGSAPTRRLARRRSIPTRIFAGYALALAAFGVVGTVSVVQHQRTAATLALLTQGYLPLSLAISEARATQGAFASMVDRLQEQDSSAAAEWLEVARRVRPGTLRSALASVRAAEGLAREPVDRQTLARIRTNLEAVLLEYELAEEDFEQLGGAGPMRDRAGTLATRQALRERERVVQRRLRDAWSAVRERISATTTAAQEDEQRATGLVLGLGMIALAIGLAVAWWSQRLLAPLPRLQERVAAVARGELDARLEHHRDDEIGVVGAEFERMVNALGQRDERLRRTERLAAIGKLAAHVTHEVRNPLNSIRLNVELLEEDLAQAAPEAQSLVRSITREVERLTAITEQYLRLARLPEPHLEPGDVGALTRDLVGFVEPEMQRANLRFDLHIDEAAPPVPMDEGQLRQALLNLIRNAREAMPQGGVVRLDVQDAGDGVTIRVEDQGTGIAADQQENIFDLFYTTKEHGTGLGLPLTQQIVVAHGGTIRCSPGEGGGTRFEIWLPRARATEPRGRAEPAAPRDARAGEGEEASASRLADPPA